MARLVRCIEGHIFETEKGPACPICGAPISSDGASPAPSAGAPAADARRPEPEAPRTAGAMVAAAKAASVGIKLAARRNATYAGGAAAALAIAALAYILWPTAPRILPLPPAAEALGRLDTSDQEALNKRIDQLLSAASAGHGTAIHLPSDSDGQAMTTLGLSPDLVSALDATDGWYQAATGDPKSGLPVIASAARRGSVAAMALLGEYLSQVPQQPTDVRIGFDALVYAGNAGMRVAHFRAADLLRQGRLRDIANAEKLLKREMTLAAQLGHPQAIEFLSKDGWAPANEEDAALKANERDPAAALAVLVAAASHGRPHAAYQLGIEMLDESRAPKGLRADQPVALQWLRFAADRNDIDALRRLGLCYAEGTGVPANKTEAFLWNYLALIKTEWVVLRPLESERAQIKAILLGQLNELGPAQKALIRPLLAPGRHEASFLAAAFGPPPRTANAPVAPAGAGHGSLPNTELRVTIGQNSDEVKVAYGLTATPTPSAGGKKTTLADQQQGLMFFFSEDGRLYTIRADRPFDGRIVGIAIGDRLSKVKAAYGEPVSTFPFAGRTANVYSISNWPDIVRFDADADGTVATIFVTRK